jgi:uncharacterized membrane protein (DUF485 family)
VPRHIRLAIAPVFALALAIVFPLFLAFIEFRSLPAEYVFLNTTFAILISLGATAMLLAAWVILTVYVPKAWRYVLIRVTLYAWGRAAQSYMRPVPPVGVDYQNGRVIIRLTVDSSMAVTEGDRFEALNTATRRKLGVLEVDIVEEASFLCQVFDRIDIDFWE